VDNLILQLQGLDPLLVYLLVFGFALLENLFPPSPSDIMIVAGGSLIGGAGQVSFLPTLLCATLGSTVGFVIAYKIGEWFGRKIIESGKIRFIPVEGIKKVEDWFARYGYWVVVGNRFLTGTRAVVSFFAGMTRLRFGLTTALCAVSALLWNTVLVTSGYMLGQNWQRIGFYLNTYSQIVTAIVVIAVAIVVARYLQARLRKSAQPVPTPREGHSHAEPGSRKRAHTHKGRHE